MLVLQGRFEVAAPAQTRQLGRVGLQAGVPRSSSPDCKLPGRDQAARFSGIMRGGEVSVLSPFPSLLLLAPLCKHAVASIILAQDPQKFRALMRACRHCPRGGLNCTWNGHSVCGAATGFLGACGSDSSGWDCWDVEGHALAPARGPPGEPWLVEQMRSPQATPEPSDRAEGSPKEGLSPHLWDRRASWNR